MNLTVNIPFDFEDFAACHQMIIDADLTPDKIAERLVYPLNDDLAPMTAEEIHLAPIFLTGLNLYSKQVLIEKEIKELSDKQNSK